VAQIEKDHSRSLGGPPGKECVHFPLKNPKRVTPINWSS